VTEGARTSAALGVLAAALAGCGGDDSSPPDPPVDPCAVAPRSTLDDGELVEALDAALDEGVNGTKAPGVVAHVVVPDRGGWYGARGVVDATDGEVPLAANAVFRVGSITKTFTAAAVLQLVEEGALGLDDPIDDHVPGWDFGPEVTLERLLNHTSGIYNYTDDPGFLVGAQTDVTPQEVIDFALSHGDLFEPGTDYTYSNTGYYLLGLALEAADDRPFDAVLRNRLLEPSDLSSLFMEQYEPGACPTTQGHVGFGTKLTEGFSMTWAWAAGGLVGDVTDLCRWADALISGDVVADATRAQMMEASELSPTTEPYGLGLAWRRAAGRDVVGHTGSTMGFNGELFIDPDSGICVAVQTNDFFGEPEAVSSRLWDAVAAAGL
jgi:D-alanyl-D-alanine carboxypeptidase